MPQKQREKTTVYVILMRVLFTVFTVWAVCYIFGNSLEPATVSAVRSGAVTQTINAGLAGVHVEYRVTEHLVRKLAHVFEFSLLGFLATLLLRVYTARMLAHLSWPLFFCLAVPVADETLQLFSAGRSSEVRDVLIDFTAACGGIAAALVLLLLLHIMVRLFVPRKKADPAAS
ncbi:MAG: VanZ family protein [Ruthenibacterium sp.]